MAGRFYFIDNSTQLNAANLNKLAYSSVVNLLKNSYFETWSEGTSAEPDGWNFNNAGGYCAIAQDSTKDEWGTYTARLLRTAGGGAARLEQDINNILAPGQTYTVVVRCNCNLANTARAFIYDDQSTYQYSDYHTGGGSMETLSVTATIDASATTMRVGVILASTNSTTYVDGIALYRGNVGPEYVHNPADQAATCNGYDTNGTFTNAPGGIRVVPFIMTGTLAGGALQETETFTLAHGCEKILHACADVLSLTTDDPDEFSVNCDNYGGGGGETTFDVTVYKHTAGNIAGGNYEVRGHYITIGWDNYAEVFGA